MVYKWKYIAAKISTLKLQSKRKPVFSPIPGQSMISNNYDDSNNFFIKMYANYMLTLFTLSLLGFSMG